MTARPRIRAGRLRLTGPPGSGVARLASGWVRAGWAAPGSWASEGDRADARLLADAALAVEGCDLRVALDAEDLACLDRWRGWGGSAPPPDARAARAALADRRARLLPARRRADLALDTTRLDLAGVRRRVVAVWTRLAALPEAQAPLLVVESFAYPGGTPRDADWCIDTRFLRNPHWVPSLRAGTGRDPAVRAYVLGQAAAADCLDAVASALAATRPAYRERGRPVVRVAFGCTGGRHRSVAMADAAARAWRRRGWPALVWHRDLGATAAGRRGAAVVGPDQASVS